MRQQKPNVSAFEKQELSKQQKIAMQNRIANGIKNSQIKPRYFHQSSTSVKKNFLNAQKS